MEQQTRGAGGTVPATVSQASERAIADDGPGDAESLSAETIDRLKEEALGSWGWGGNLANQVDQLHAVVDRLAVAQERIRQDHADLWRWADNDAAPVLRFLTGAHVELGAKPARPRGLQPVYDRLDNLEMHMGELAHELQRVCAALEQLSSLVEERPQ